MRCACRWFIVDDVDMLEDDLQLLKSLFEAEGEGLSKPQIEELCAPLAGLLVTMQLDSGILMSNFKQVGLPLVPADVVASREGSQRRAIDSSFTPKQSAQALSPSDSPVPDRDLGYHHQVSNHFFKIANICCQAVHKQTAGELQSRTALWKNAGDVQKQRPGPCH